MKLWPMLVAGALLIGCGQGAPRTTADPHLDGKPENEVHTEGLVELTPEQRRMAGIEVEQAIFRSIQPTLEAPAVVNSTTRGRALVTPPVAGRVVELRVDLGSTVRQGQVLALIESVELAEAWSNIAEAERQRDAARGSLEDAQAEVELAKAKLVASQASLARQRDLVEAGAFSQAPLQQAQSELNDAQSDLLSVQKEQASHAELVRRLENLYRDGIVSRVDLEAARLELQQDEIRMDRAEARVAAAKATYERERNIAARGLLNAREVQSAEAEVRAASLELDRARLRVRTNATAVSSAERAVSNARYVYGSLCGGAPASGGRVSLVAPIAGSVTEVSVTRGQAVDRTQALMTVENLSSVWVTASVPEADLGKIRIGARVAIETKGTASGSFHGVVQVIGHRVDPSTRSVPVQCLVEDARGDLKPEMFATAKLAYGEGQGRLTVPRSAVVREGSRTFVFVEDEHGFVRTPVSLGEEAGGYVDVLGGLSSGARVVAKGTFVLNSELLKAELKGHDH